MCIIPGAESGKHFHSLGAHQILRIYKYTHSLYCPLTRPSSFDFGLDTRQGPDHHGCEARMLLRGLQEVGLDSTYI